jgi:ribosomal protein S18 acetylase RimI-like enzyme
VIRAVQQNKYFCPVKHLLNNPVYHALLSGDRHLSCGAGAVKYFPDEVSPFAGFEEGYAKGFAELHEQLPAGRKILYAIPSFIQQPEGWTLEHEIEGLQFVFTGNIAVTDKNPAIVPLLDIHVEQMIQLARLTKPGPFGQRTIDFGFYHGIFDNDQLVAMTGQRLHVGNCTEISAVCTHPDHTGKGYAFALIEHQLQIILQQGQQPFLHVRADNERAIALYQRMGFTISRSMNFYFMRRR